MWREKYSLDDLKLIMTTRTVVSNRENMDQFILRHLFVFE